MFNLCLRVTICLILFMGCKLPELQALDISVQFPPGTLFHIGADAPAKAAIAAAAADISEAITSSLNPISTDIYTGSSGSTTATYDWNYQYLNPSTGFVTRVENATAPADTVPLYVGTRLLGQDDLGVGGPGTVGFEVSLNNANNANQAQAAISAAANLSEQALLRGAGPVISTLAGQLDFENGLIFNSSVDYGVTTGSLSFDIDEDNNGSVDSAASLDEYWHWSHTTEVADDKFDLYSVAVHEILHTLGIGTSQSWNSLANGTTWTGAEAITVHGTGNGLIQADGDHITSNVMSTRISDGALQEAVMDPNILDGTRKELTALDLAFLRDIGYETIVPAVFDSADYDTDGDVDGADLAILQNWYGVTSQGDADGDGDTDGNDLLIWQRQHTGPIGSSVASVPEPACITLCSTAMLLAGLRRSRR